MNSLYYILMNIFSTDFFFTLLRVTTPILFAALGAVIANKAGVTNIALEGIMLMAALFGVIGSGYSGSLLIGLLSAIVGGSIICIILIYFSLFLDTDIVLSGIALNLLALGGTVFLLFTFSGDRGVSKNISSLVFPNISIPIIKDIPILGNILSGHNLLTYISFICVWIVSVFLNKTVLGLRLRAVGENENAASSVGINTKRIKIIALLISGLLASLGGAYMSMGYLSNFSRNMISGRGFIALAAEAMGKSTPIGTLVSSLIFGAAESVSFMLQSLAIPGEIVRMIPYLATIIGLIVYAQSTNNKKETINKKLLNKSISQGDKNGK